MEPNRPDRADFASPFDKLRVKRMGASGKAAETPYPTTSRPSSILASAPSGSALNAAGSSLSAGIGR